MTPAQVAKIMALAKRMMRDSWADGGDASWMPAHDELEAALRDAPQQAEGWVMVPVEPTPAMLVAMWDHREAMRGQSENRIARAGYAAMIASRPSAPTAVEPDERKPLTDEQIEKLRDATFSINNPFCPVDSKSMRKAVRAAEHAHGITARASKGTPL